MLNALAQGEEEDVADEQEPEGEDLVGGDGEDDSDEEVLANNHAFDIKIINFACQDDRKFKKKGRRANARDFIIDEAEVRHRHKNQKTLKSSIARLTQTTRRMKTLGGTMVTGMLLIPMRRTKLARLPPMWKLTCGSATARLARVVSKWTRWMSRRLRSTTGIGGRVCWVGLGNTVGPSTMFNDCNSDFFHNTISTGNSQVQ